MLSKEMEATRQKAATTFLSWDERVDPLLLPKLFEFYGLEVPEDNLDISFFSCSC